MAAIRADIIEEVTRLSSHVDTGHQMLRTGGTHGPRLTFLAEEMMREADAICTKAATLDLTRIGLDLKSSVDQFRALAQTIE